jgi:hypothetical protein
MLLQLALDAFGKRKMCGYSFRQNARITVGAVTALIITGWMFVLVLAFLSM